MLIGDRAIELVLEGYRRALEETPRPHHRHRIEHAMLMADDLMDTMQALGVVVVPQPEFLWWLTRAYLAGLGERACALMPFRAGCNGACPSGSASTSRWCQATRFWAGALPSPAPAATALALCPKRAWTPDRSAAVHHRRGVCHFRQRSGDARARHAGTLYGAVAPARADRRRRHAGDCHQRRPAQSMRG